MIIYYCDRCKWEKLISHGVPVNQCGGCGKHGLNYVGMNEQEYLIYLQICNENDDKSVHNVLPKVRIKCK